MKIFAIKDKRTGHYKPQLMLFPHVAEVCRQMEIIVNNPDTDLYKWPLDYQLDQLGDFDTKNGNFTRDPKEIVQIIDLKRPQEVRQNRQVVDPVSENGIQ